VDVRTVDGQTLEFTLPPLGEGTHNLTLPQGALRSVRGTANDLFVSQLTVDRTSPRVTFSSLQEGDVAAGDSLTFVAVFDELLDATNLDPSDIRLVGRVSGSLAPVRFDYDPGTSRLTVEYDGLVEGPFTLTLVSGDGALEDLAGNDLDGETSGRLIPPDVSGDGVPGGDFVINFEVDAVSTETSPFARIEPLGSLIAASRGNTGRLHDGSDRDDFELFAQVGETVGAVVWPVDERATLSVQVVGGEASWTASAPGEPVVLPPTPIETTQVVVLEISGDRTTDYRVDVYRNTSLELEVGDSGRDNVAAIDGSFISLGSGRFAVVGESRPTTTEVEVVVFGAQPATGDILRIDVASGQVLDRFAAPDDLAADDTRIGLTMGEGGRVLLYVNSDRDPTVLWRLDPVTGSVLSQETLSGQPIDGLAFESSPEDGEPLLFLAHTEADIHRQEGYAGPETEGWATGAPVGGLGGDDAGRQFGYFGDGFIHEYDPVSDTDQWISSLPAPATDIEGLAFIADVLYVSTASGQLVTLDPDDGAVLAEFAVAGGGLFGLGAAVPLGGIDDLIINGSFETGDFQGWTARNNGVIELTPWTVGPVGGGWFRSTSPIDGSLNAYNGFDGDAGLEYELFQDVTVPPSGDVTLTTNHRIVFDGLGIPSTADRVFAISIRDPRDNSVLQDLYTETVTLNGAPRTDLGWNQQTFDLSQFSGQSIRVHFLERIPESFTGPANIEFDALSLEVDRRGVMEVPEDDLYSLDLTGRAGRSIDVILTGLDGAEYPDAVLEVIGPDGRMVLARSAEGGLAAAADNYDQGILDFVVPEDGIYGIRFRSTRPGTYSLVVTESLAFDTEFNNGLADPLRILSDGTGALGFLGEVGGGTLYGSDRDGQLFTIDLESGAGALVGVLSGPSTEIEYDPISGRSFSQFPDGVFAGQEFDLATGRAIGEAIANGMAFNGMEWIGTNLYATGIPEPRGRSELHILDPFAGTTTTVGATGLGPISGLAYDSATDRLFGIAGGPGPADLFSIDRDTGTATAIGSTGIQAGSLEIGPDGLLYAGGTGADQGQLFVIDPVSGSAQLVGNTGFGPVTGLLLGPEVATGEHDRPISGQPS
ncbi:MAG: hypothetical protein ACC645_18420, partial [Pirellulales bacterium]